MLYEHNLKELYGKLAKVSNFDVFTEHGIHALQSPTNHPALNNAFGNITQQSIATLIDYFKTKPFTVLLDADNDVGHHSLVAHQFEPHAALPEMHFQLSSHMPSKQPPPNCKLEPVTTHQQFVTWCTLASQVLQVPYDTTYAYNLPLFKLGPQEVLFLLGHYQNQPAATGMVHMGANSAMISSITVQPAFRRKGIARALTHTCMQVAQDASLEHVTLIAFSMARTLYESMGFTITRYIRAFSAQ